VVLKKTADLFSFNLLPAEIRGLMNTLQKGKRVKTYLQREGRTRE